LEDSLVVDKDMSALTGDAPPPAALPTRQHAAPAAGTFLAILLSIFYGNYVAEFDDESNPEFEDSFAAEFVARSV
jgi:hypothetical protein